MEITRKLSTDAAKDFEESYFDWLRNTDRL